jgi:hypothetical protein
MSDSDNNTQGAMRPYPPAVVVTEAVVTFASRAGDLEQVGMWARHGVGVQTGGPMCAAANGDLLEVGLVLVKELSADVGQAVE